MTTVLYVTSEPRLMEVHRTAFKRNGLTIDGPYTNFSEALNRIILVGTSVLLDPERLPPYARRKWNTPYREHTSKLNRHVVGADAGIDCDELKLGLHLYRLLRDRSSARLVLFSTMYGPESAKYQRLKTTTDQDPTTRLVQVPPFIQSRDLIARITEALK